LSIASMPKSMAYLNRILSRHKTKKPGRGQGFFMVFTSS
jgi:hypothetical protein